MNKKKLIILLSIKAILLVVVLIVILITSPTDSLVESELIEETPRALWSKKIIGYSSTAHPIEVHQFGSGEKKLLLVGGIHGGYEWNTVVLAEALIAYFKSNPDTILSDVSLSVIPVLNPDGLVRTFGTTSLEHTDTIADEDLRAGRVNAKGVDLNRNFDCNWEETATWQNELIGAGDEVFSEPETKALRDFVLEWSPRAAIFWHSQAGAVYGATCAEEITPENIELLAVYAGATSYRSFPIFSDYPVSGDVESWLTTLGIPTLTVELTTRTESEFEENLAAVTAVFTWLSQK